MYGVYCGRPTGVRNAPSLSPRQRRIGVYLSYQEENLRTPNLVAFVRYLHQQLGRKLILIWDRWSVHRSAAKTLLRKSPRWLSIEWLPAYAPDLNPVEAMWSYTKHADLANFLPRDLGELEEALLDSVVAQRYDRRLKESSFQTAQLDL